MKFQKKVMRNQIFEQYGSRVLFFGSCWVYLGANLCDSLKWSPAIVKLGLGSQSPWLF